MPKMSLSHKILWTIPNRVLNILISPGGRGQLARPPGTTDNFPSLEGINLPLFFVFMFLVYLGLPPLVWFPLSIDPLFSTCHRLPRW